MNITIKINDELTELQKEIIEKYWTLTNMKFENKPNKLKQEYEITLHELNKLIKDYSVCEVRTGNCSECEVELIQRFTSQTGFKERLVCSVKTCKECKEKLDIEAYQIQEDYIIQTLNKGLIDRQWEILNQDELELLKNIVRINDRNTIIAKCLSGENYGDWKVINKLEKLRLIYLEKNGRHVREFHFLEELASEIFFLEVKNEEFNNVKNDFGFSLAKKINKQKPQQPDYSGFFILPTDIVLRKDVEYIYGGWIQTDGSINLKFTPKEDLFSVKHKDTEPEHIKGIMSNMLNNISED